MQCKRVENLKFDLYAFQYCIRDKKKYELNILKI